MASTVSIDVRTLVATGVAAGATVLAYLVGSVQTSGMPADAAPPPARTAPAAAPVAPDTPSIAMTGTGRATGVPDQVAFDLTISTTAPDVTEALTAANAASRDVLVALLAQGVDADDVQTTGLSLRPTYDYSGDGPAVLTGYEAKQKLSVVVRSLSDAGAVISAAVEAGGNAVRLSDVRLQVGDKDALLARARDGAFAQAQAKGEQYAAAAGRSLGEVVSVREVTATSYQPQVENFRAAADVSLSKVPIRAGTDELGVTVSVIWSFA